MTACLEVITAVVIMVEGTMGIIMALTVVVTVMVMGCHLREGVTAGSVAQAAER